MAEVWKTVANFDLYEVSNMGRIRRRVKYLGTGPGSPLTPSLQNNGYLKVTLCDSGKMVSKMLHRLVAIAFVPNPNNLPEVNHTGNTTDNRATKLEWRSRLGNMQHAVLNGLTKGIGVHNVGRGIKRWRAEYNPTPNKSKVLGYFMTKAEALKARKVALKTLEDIL